MGWFYSALHILFTSIPISELVVVVARAVAIFHRFMSDGYLNCEDKLQTSLSIVTDDALICKVFEAIKAKLEEKVKLERNRTPQNTVSHSQSMKTLERFVFGENQ